MEGISMKNRYCYGYGPPKWEIFFTLIELLVVVSIIAILASLLLPSLSKARESTRGVVCAGNLKQLGAAIQLYTQDYKEYWIPKNYMSTPILRDNYFSNPASFQKTVFCPSAQNDYFDWGPGWMNLTYVVAYKYIQHTASGDNSEDYRYRMLKLPEIPSPSTTGTMVDGSENWVLSEDHLERLRMRHNGGANILYCDAHVAKRMSKDINFNIFIAK